MPGMQGREVAQQVRKFQQDAAVLYMSGYAEGLLSAQGALEPGINLIEKPFNQKSLLRKVREILHARQPALIPGRGPEAAAAGRPLSRRATAGLLATRERENAWNHRRN
jgi:FixJ family two-component response regulator